MFKKFIYSLSISLVALALWPSQSPARSAEDPEYEEVSYDDLLQRISHKKTYLKQESASPFDDVLIHVGLGYVTAFSQTSIQGNNLSNQFSGLQLSLGINLFSPHWYSEAAWRNYGVQNHFTQETGLRELDFRLGYQDALNGQWNYRLGTGLATRFFHYSDTAKDINIDATTPAMMINFGLFAKMSEFVSLGAEASFRSPLVSSNDKGSWDLSLQTLTSF